MSSCRDDERGDRVSEEVVASLSSLDMNPTQRAGVAGIAIVGMHSSNSTWLPWLL